MSTPPWVIRRQPLAEDATYPYPWEYGYRPEEDTCGAGGHYGSVATFEQAVDSVLREWADHVLHGGD